MSNSVRWFATGLLVALGTCSAIAEIGVQLPIKTEAGLVRGVANADGKISMFKGVPFAMPPKGQLRWKEPQPVAPWKGVRETTKFSSNCIQAPYREFLPFTQEFMAVNPSSEDCLYLNIWSPAKSASDKLAVYFYIHGGGFMGGSGDAPIYDGENLAKQGIVVVTFNYRLGALGFLVHPELSKESPHHSSGNYGLLDQIAALKWVRKNIEAFGGDPKKVTIGGQSAGAGSVRVLLHSPLTKGMFRAAVMESGTGVASNMTKTQADAEKDGIEFAKSRGVTSLDEMRKILAPTLAAPGPADIDPKKPMPVAFRPVVDGYVMTEEGASRNFTEVPVLTGWNANENLRPPIPRDVYLQQLKQRFGELTDTFLKLYSADDEAQSKASQSKSGLDRRLIGLKLWAAASKIPVYTYLFTQAIPWPGHPEFGAFHTGEMPYIMNNLDKLQTHPFDAVDRLVANTFSTYLVNFVKTGDPNGPSLPKWAPYKDGSDVTMEIGRSVAPIQIATPEAVKFWSDYLVSPAAKNAPPML